MKVRRILTVLALGVGATWILLWQLGGMTDATFAQGLDGYATYYVAPGGACGGMLPCFNSVQAAVDAVDDSGEVVKVAAGVYTDVSSRQFMTQVVYLDKTLILRGGYTRTNWSTSNPLSNPTVLDAQGKGRVLYISGHISPTIQGLYISGGVADYDGGGIHIYDCSPTLAGNIILSNTAASGDGGGIYIGNGSPTLDGNTVIGNHAPNGGGIGIHGGSPLLTHNMIVSNSASNYGGGIYTYRASPTIVNNRIMSNTTSRNGGGLFIDDYSSPAVINNIIARNGADSNGGGIYLDWYSTPSIINNTIAANDRGPDWANEGIFMYNSPSPVIVNNIIVTQTSCIGGAPYTITVDYNVFWNCYIRDSWIASDTHNIYQDPKLTDDYHLSINSPAINAGTGDYAPSTDFDDELRPAGTGYDIGADEYYGPALQVHKQAAFVASRLEGSFTYTLRVTNTGTVSLTVFITDNLPEHAIPAGILTWTRMITAPGGAWTKQVVITVEKGYAGILTNVLQATSAEGASGAYTVTSLWYPIYLPVILRNY